MNDFLIDVISFFVSFILGFAFMSAVTIVPRMYRSHKQNKKENEDNKIAEIHPLFVFILFPTRMMIYAAVENRYGIKIVSVDSKIKNLN